MIGKEKSDNELYKCPTEMISSQWNTHNTLILELSVSPNNVKKYCTRGQDDSILIS